MKAAFRLLILLGAFMALLSAGPAEAKSNGRIAGNVKSATGSPLSDALIRVFKIAERNQARLVAKSDRNGLFRLAGLNPGDYYLEIIRPGYQTLTTKSFTINPGRTTSLEIVLQEFIDYISNDEDPRNWELKTVMRSSSDRRLIFRHLPGNPLTEGEAAEQKFCRSGSMSIASNSFPYGQTYLARSQASPNGVSSNFAFTEPFSQRSRMILSGQLDFGGGSFWRLRNTYNYRPDKDRDYRISVGYGRMNTNYLGSNSISQQLLSGESILHQPAVQTLALGFEGNAGFLDLMAVKYGFDYSRLRYGASRNFFNPSLQIIITPSEGWSLKASSTSQRLSDANSILLPDGEVLNLSEPTIITMINNRVSMSQVRHTEISLQRSFARDTAVEVAVYQDRTQGSGLPFMVTAVTPLERRSHLIELGDERSSQRGLRIAMNRQILDFLSGSVAYGYGTAATFSGFDEPISTNAWDGNFLSYTQQRVQHALTGRLDATIPVTKTNVIATVQWYPGNPLTPIDWFSDRMDFGTKSTNFEIRQALPVPEFFASTGQWEVLVDMRNLLNQGRETIKTTDGELILNRNPRSLRFGLSLNFR